MLGVLTVESEQYKLVFCRPTHTLPVLMSVLSASLDDTLLIST